MLTAVQNGKIKRSVRFWEDEITSIIFGPLAYLDDHELAWNFVSALSRLATSRNVMLNGERPDSVEFEFWPGWEPRFAHSGIRTVEPDLVIRFQKQGRPIVNVLIEIKWDSPISPPCELIKQWVHRDNPNEEWLHFYVTKRMSVSKQDVKNSKKIASATSGCISRCCNNRTDNQYVFHKFDVTDWAARLIPATWSHVALAAESLNNHWASSVSLFLQKQGVRPFTGFPGLHLPRLEKTDAVFYHVRPWFEFAPQRRITEKTNTRFFEDQPNEITI